MWFLGILLIGGLIALATAPSSSGPLVQTPMANVVANWPTFFVIDVEKLRALGYEPKITSSYAATDPKKTTGAYQIDPRTAQAVVGTLGIWLSAQIFTNKNRVWIGTPIQDETNASTTIPLEVGPSRPSGSGWAEVVAS